MIPTMEKYNDTINNAIDLLPDLRTLIDECYVTVYGGFIRWAIHRASQQEDAEVTMEEVCEYLDSADVDLRIKSPSGGGWCYKNLKAVQKLVTAHGARMEFIGNGYDGLGNAYVPSVNTEDLPLDSRSVYTGTYAIWYPHPLDPARWIRYELSIFSTCTSGYYDDFTVNGFTHQGVQKCTSEYMLTKFPHCYTDGYSNDILRGLNDITQKNLEIKGRNSGFSNLMKKVWRLRKMWKKGYRPRDEEAKRTIWTWINRINEDEHKYWGGKTHSYILEDEKSMSAPSVLGEEPTTIYACKHKYRKLTMEDIHSDPLLQEIKEYCRPNYEILYRFRGDHYVIQEQKFNDVPEDAPKSEKYQWVLIHNGPMRTFENLTFKSIDGKSRFFEHDISLTPGRYDHEMKLTIDSKTYTIHDCLR